MTESASIRGLKVGDINTLVRMARVEGWICDAREFEIHRRLKSALAVVATEGDVPIGCVTAFTHRRVAWIGNLLVGRERRGRGLGTALLGHALAWTEGRGFETALLASAPKAANLYGRFGFKPLATINRWRREAAPAAQFLFKAIGDRHTLRRIVGLDGVCWDDDRARLLRMIHPERTCVITKEDDGFLMFGWVGDDLVIGPGAMVGTTAGKEAHLIDRVLERIDPGQSVVLDAFAVNERLAKALEERKFSIASSTALMCRGPMPQIKFRRILATASLGSMG